MTSIAEMRAGAEISAELKGNDKLSDLPGMRRQNSKSFSNRTKEFNQDQCKGRKESEVLVRLKAATKPQQEWRG